MTLFLIRNSFTCASTGFSQFKTYVDKILEFYQTLFAVTKYCTGFGATYNPRFIEGKNLEYECCLILKGCDKYLPYMHYRHGFLNVNLYMAYLTANAWKISRNV